MRPLILIVSLLTHLPFALNVEAQKLNDIQMIGSHNSYKQAIEAPLLASIAQQNEPLARSLDYHHPSLNVQLDQGMRVLELDVYYDPDGALYQKPNGLQQMKSSGVEPLEYDPDDVMKTPGFKVLHVQDIDFRSNCLTFTGCLRELAEWSASHKQHMPIVITINAKDSAIDLPGFVKPLKFSAEAFDALDREIRDVFDEDHLITPDMVRGDSDTLREAVTANKWPLLSEVRGKFLFMLDEAKQKYQPYIKDHSSLRGRVMFVNAPPQDPEGAFLIINDPISEKDEIERFVKSGYLVRTRADADTAEARSGKVERREAALASGAHFISTDYYLEDKRFSTGYRVALPGGGVVRCNPIRWIKNCSVAE